MTQPAKTTRFDIPLRGVLHCPASAPAPVILIAHGFKGFMDWGMFPWLAARFASAGFAAARFDFSLNGADENGDFSRLDDFRRNTLSHEQRDLAALIAAVTRGDAPFGGVARPDRVGLLGHSRGGGGVLLAAAAQPDVAAVATLAAVAETQRFPPAALAKAERDGSFPILNTRTNQVMPVGVEYFRDARNHDILAAAAAMAQPLLLVHGSADSSVPIAEGRRIAAVHGELLEIDGASHTFGAVHPFAGPTPELERATDAIVEFFGRTLA